MKLMFANGYRTVVACGACSCNTAMIITAIRLQRQKAGGRMTILTFGIRRDMKFRLPNGQDTVMAVAAFTENFKMVNKANKVKTECGMTGLTHITGGEVIS